MSLYAYTATDVKGRVVKGKEKAENRHELIETLREQNLFCTDCETVEEEKPKARYKFTTKKLSIFCRQLSSMLTAGINLVRAIHILMTQEENAKAKEVLRDIYEELQRGRSFSETLESRPGVFPALFTSMVAAGEVSGNLDIIVARVSDHYAKEARLKNTVTKAMVYPIVLSVLMIAVVIVLFTFIMPTFMDMFTNPDDIPTLTRIMFGISSFITDKWYILVIIIVALVVVIRLMMKTPSIRIKIDKLICNFPKIGKLVCTVYTGRFARTMSNLFASGMQMVECIEKSVQTLGNLYIIDRFDFVLDEVKKGETFSASIAKIGIFDGIFVSSVYIGEESGRLEEILAKNADFYDEESDAAIGKLVSMMEPVMIIIMGVMVAMVLMAIFPALYGSYGAMAQ